MRPPLRLRALLGRRSAQRGRRTPSAQHPEAAAAVLGRARPRACAAWVAVPALQRCVRGESSQPQAHLASAVAATLAVLRLARAGSRADVVQPEALLHCCRRDRRPGARAAHRADAADQDLAAHRGALRLHGKRRVSRTAHAHHAAREERAQAAGGARARPTCESREHASRTGALSAQMHSVRSQPAAPVIPGWSHSPVSCSTQRGAEGGGQ